MEKTREKKSNYTILAMAGTIAIAIVSIFLFVIANWIFPFRRGEFLDMPTLFIMGSFLSLFMLLASIYLIYTYLKDYMELKSRFTLGILMMIISFMLFSLSSMPWLHNIFGVYGRPGIFSVIPYFFAALSLAILVWLSSK